MEQTIDENCHILCEDIRKLREAGLKKGRGRGGNKQLTIIATVHAKQEVNEGGVRKGKGSVRENARINMTTKDARPLVNEGGSRKDRGAMRPKPRDRNGYGSRLG